MIQPDRPKEPLSFCRVHSYHMAEELALSVSTEGSYLYGTNEGNFPSYRRRMYYYLIGKSKEGSEHVWLTRTPSPAVVRGL